MSGVAIAGIGFAVMLVLIAVRMPVALAMIVVGSLGYISLTSFGAFLNFMKATPYFVFSKYSIAVIPLFILMGALAEQSGLARDLFKAAAATLGHRKGGLLMGVIAACTGFGAICGSSVATTATFSRVAYPELVRNGCNPGLSTGVIAVGGTLGILIPPSVILIIYAILTEQNIVTLFAAAMIPGLVAAAIYCVVIAILVTRRPELAPVAPRVPWRDRLPYLGAIWPVMLIAALVLGGIYSGLLTATEAAGAGVVAVLAVGVLTRRIGWPELIKSLRITAETSAMIFVILLGAELFNAFLAVSRMPTVVSDWVSAQGFAPGLVIGCFLLIYILLGALMDEIAMLLLTLPVFFPVVLGLDLGLPPGSVGVWFGVLVLVTVGMGLTAPPVGLNVFVVNAIVKTVPLPQTYKAILPFLVADIVRLGLIFAFPIIVLGPIGLMG